MTLATMRPESRVRPPMVARCQQRHNGRFKGVIHGRLRIGASTTPGAWLLPHWLGVFQKKYLQLAVDNIQVNSQRVLDRLQAGQIALGVVGCVPDTDLFQVMSLVVGRQHVLSRLRPHPLTISGGKSVESTL